MRYSIEMLPNGLIRVFDYATKTSVTYTSDGERYGGGGQHTWRTDEIVQEFIGR